MESINSRSLENSNNTNNENESDLDFLSDYQVIQISDLRKIPEIPLNLIYKKIEKEGFSVFNTHNNLVVIENGISKNQYLLENKIFERVSRLENGKEFTLYEEFEKKDGWKVNENFRTKTEENFITNDDWISVDKIRQKVKGNAIIQYILRKLADEFLSLKLIEQTLDEVNESKLEWLLMRKNLYNSSFHVTQVLKYEGEEEEEDIDEIENQLSIIQLSFTFDVLKRRILFYQHETGSKRLEIQRVVMNYQKGPTSTSTTSTSTSTSTSTTSYFQHPTSFKNYD